MTITSEKLRHWAQMASLTSEGASCLSAEQLAQTAEYIDAQAEAVAGLKASLECSCRQNQNQAARIAELEFIRNSADQVQREYAEALGCAGDNESILAAIADQASEIEKTKSRYNEVSGWYCKMKTRMLAAEKELAYFKRQSSENNT
ncbi:hypothetical protein PMPD1_3138 [Paramixta manurensis]|uniref:Uncharacterized protein n=1 Tax=Paramixta manurensis TaxID=2740817 RepID=A0A6M8UBG3_9GAMM|nr:hypothetical protein PMPD1_3138 [Erwiniaceae bacterium PD-1]